MKKSTIFKVVLVIVAGLLLCFLINDYFKTKKNYSDIKKVIAEKNQLVKKISDNNLQLNDRIASKDAAEIVYKEKLDSLSRQLKIKPKSIIQTIEVDSKIDAEISAKTDTFTNPTTKTIDSLSFSYSDKWINIQGIVKKEGTDLNIKGNDSLYITRYRKGNNTVVDIRNTNKYIKLSGASTLSIEDPKLPLIQVKPYVGVGYDPVHKIIGPSIGIGINFNIFR
jgi:hypothetical protein